MLPVSLMTVSLYAANKGFFDDVPVKSVLAFEAGLHGFMKTSHSDLLNRVETTKALSKEDDAALAVARGDKVLRRRVVSAHVASQVRQMMIGVVRSGTGTAAAIPGVT